MPFRPHFACEAYTLHCIDHAIVHMSDWINDALLAHSKPYLIGSAGIIAYKIPKHEGNVNNAKPRAGILENFLDE